MTPHKAQGNTLKTVILALYTWPIHQRQIYYCVFVVEISRIYYSEDIRVILPCNTDERFT